MAAGEVMGFVTKVPAAPFGRLECHEGSAVLTLPTACSRTSLQMVTPYIFYRDRMSPDLTLVAEILKLKILYF
jgi:hypothetical protein